ncbi:MAG: hypothetical protein HY331_05580, partial [Chloroflexi bacterium]|nr:hypothetical protein [Chloroflexota bacterium]
LLPSPAHGRGAGGEGASLILPRVPTSSYEFLRVPGARRAGGGGAPLQSAFAVVGAIALVGAAAAGLRGVYFDPASGKPDARTPAAYVSATATEAALLFWPPDHPLAFYQRSPARRDHFVTRPATVAADLTRLVAGRRTVFWEASDTVDNDPWGLVPFLLGKTAQSVEVQALGGYRIHRYVLPPDTSFDLGSFRPASFQFGDRLALVGVAFGASGDRPALPMDRPAWVVLRFRSLAELPPDLKITVRLRDDAGHLLGQSDVVLFDGRGAPTGFWPVGTETLAVALVQPSPGTPPTRAAVEVGVYDARTSAPLPLAGGMAPLAPLGHLDLARPSRPPAADTLGLDRRLDLSSGAVDLLGVRLSLPETVDAGGQIGLRLYWRVRAPMAAPPDFALGLRAGDGQDHSEQVHPVLGEVLKSVPWEPGDVLSEERALAVDPRLPTGQYTLALSFAGQRADLGQLTVRARSVAAAGDLPPTARIIGARFAGGIELAGYRLDGPARAGGRLKLTLFWRADRRLLSSYTVFTHLAGPTGIVGQHDGLPAGGSAPTTLWLPGEIVVDEHELPVAGNAGGELALRVGLYRLETGERLALVAGGDHVLLGSVRMER